MTQSIVVRCANPRERRELRRKLIEQAAKLGQRVEAVAEGSFKLKITGEREALDTLFVGIRR